MGKTDAIEKIDVCMSGQHCSQIKLLLLGATLIQPKNGSFNNCNCNSDFSIDSKKKT